MGGDRYPESAELANRISGVWQTMETSVLNQSALLNYPEDGRIKFNRSGSL